MEQISAAENITIEMDDNRWRMIVNGKVEPQVLFEASSGHPVNYKNEFASTRRLPPDGSLATDYIQRIVLGWSNTDSAWHLGLLLEAELAQTRGSRWCEIAYWPDPSSTVFSSIAARAGESLAQVVTRPFSLVPPKPQEAVVPEAPMPALPELPLAIDSEWRLEQTSSGQLQLARSAQQRWTAIRRIAWYAFWSVIFFVLVYANLNSGIAPANPAFLPYLGLFSGLVLVGLIFKNIYELLTVVNRIVIDRQARQIQGQHGTRPRWTHHGDELQAIYISQVVGKRRGSKPATYYGELNLHLKGKNAFRYLLGAEQIEEYQAEADSPTDEVVQLTARDFTTNVQAAALHIGQALEVPVWYDRRSA
ncbi:MAG: hypothetical protein K8J31_25705 [Anaerolineae bacterium]|nr:hypothetical protein [Anaerolineae bacterium]